MPHPTTWTRVLGNGVAAEAIEAALQPLLVAPTAEVPARASRQIALDGKTLRGSISPASSAGVHLLTAYQVDDRVPLMQVKVSAKANELVVAPQILAQLDLQGVLVTGDAMFAQRSLSSQIVEAGGDYCWIVKENQPTLYDDLRLLFGPQVATLPGTSAIPDDFETVRSVDKGHGRLEERVLRSSSLLAEYQGWPYLAIENGLHYRRDVTLKEDASLARMGQAPHVLATLNNFICGLTAQAGITNLAACQRSMAATFDRWLFRL
jgi:predicted transposase YbfD/YdcC